MSAARPGERVPNPVTVLVLGWLVPGAGHWVLGRRKRAALFCAILTLTFLVGFAMAEYRNVSYSRHEYYFVGQSFCGVLTIATATVSESLPPLGRPIPGEDRGMLYTCVASLLNALLCLDAYERAVKARAGDAQGGSGARGPEGKK
ncbi:MAG: hypothetical protein HY720_17805 [Planctomycetes bacterium]|nr:hypothetical protein [Planctomycetota bacterium]